LISPTAAQGHHDAELTDDGDAPLDFDAGMSAAADISCGRR
jgi:hypothetical protein